MIRDATPADLPALRAIQATSLDEPWEALLETGVDGLPLTLVVTAGRDEPVGYAIAIPEGGTAYVAEFAVAPGHRGEGHGTRLMSALLGRLAADDVAEVRLTVRVSDRRARSFYDGHGFRVRSLLPQHYVDDDALVLALSLTGDGSDR